MHFKLIDDKGDDAMHVACGQKDVIDADHNYVITVSGPVPKDQGVRSAPVIVRDILNTW